MKFSKEGLPDRCQSEGGKCCFLGYKELKALVVDSRVISISGLQKIFSVS